MKRFISIAAALAMTATAGFAQTTTQAGVLGQSDNPAYPLQVQGANGVVYNCEETIVSVDGVNARRCIRTGAPVGLFAAGTGLATGGAIAAGALLIIAVASDGSTSTTTSSNDL